MQIMAAAAARISGIENACAQSNVRTNWSTEQTKTKIRSTGRTAWSFYLRLCCVQSDNRLFQRVSSQSPAIPSPVIPLILKAQLSAVKQQNEDRTASHSISVWFYSNPSCAIIITHRPRLSKVVWTWSSTFDVQWIRFCLMHILKRITV